MSPYSLTPIPRESEGEDRAALRRALIARREQLPDRSAKEAALTAAVVRAVTALEPICLGAYCATRGEFDPLPALRQLAQALPDVQFALPVVDPATRQMRFVAWAPGEALQAGAYGIAVPVDQSRTVEPDALLVPCVGFVEAGLRLGYGGGYYDRYMAGRGDVYTIGLAFDLCELDDLRAEPHDHLLDLILTETGSFGLEAGLLGDEEL
ncbi:MAG: 5-formyltetrahydrofolate cyclo-ligase [Thiomonas sp.]|uniref:Putative 5-formyltetrahydrofolate cyclo-ligase n=1 Tax=mine drainage metagenome TaxID=410659 RepID=E6PMU1_9ZZZZ